MKRSLSLTTLAVALAARVVFAQQPEHLTLKDAEERAAKNHPRVLAGQYGAQAAAQTIREVRSTYFPAAVVNLTGADAADGTRIAAGGLNNPTILDRFAYGISGAQMITDFGRTADLTASATLRADSAREDAEDLRATTLLQVDRAYFDALRAQSIERVANETVAARQLVVDQVTELANAGLKSSLDVSFATVNLSEAKLLVLQASNDTAAAFATLSAALGAPQSSTYELADEALPPAPASDSSALIAQALQERPDVARERFAEQSATKLAQAEGALRFPTLSLVGAAGFTPFHQLGLTDRYSAIGLNITFPITNGSLYSARRAEAGFRANAQEQVRRDLEDRVARDVRIAWLDTQAAFERMDLTAQLLTQATDSLDLAQQRYTLGLASIVELTQAQLNLTRAQIEQATARYAYQERSAALRFQIGEMK